MATVRHLGLLPGGACYTSTIQTLNPALTLQEATDAVWRVAKWGCSLPLIQDDDLTEKLSSEKDLVCSNWSYFIYGDVSPGGLPNMGNDFFYSLGIGAPFGGERNESSFNSLNLVQNGLSVFSDVGYYDGPSTLLFSPTVTKDPSQYLRLQYIFKYRFAYGFMPDGPNEGLGYVRYLEEDEDLLPDESFEEGETGELFFYPEKWWPYDPGDGLGPIYDSTTGEQLREFPA
jgi:hypothetical protein